VGGVVKSRVSAACASFPRWDDDIEAREGRHLDQSGDDAPFLSDAPPPGAAN